MMGRHRDGKHNPLERPQASEGEDKVVAGGTSHADQGGDFVFQTEIGMDLETSHFTAGHFKLRDDTEKKRLRWRLPHSSRLRGEIRHIYIFVVKAARFQKVEYFV